jgi:methyl-accepting chemotaxis protein
VFWQEKKKERVEKTENESNKKEEKLEEKDESEDLEKEIREKVFISFIISLVFIISTGLIIGIIITLVRLNWWKFISPLISKTLPPLLAIYFSILLIFAVILWIKVRDLIVEINERVKRAKTSDNALSEISQKVSSAAQFTFISSLSAYFLTAILTPVVIHFQDIGDIHVSIIYVSSIISVSFPSAFVASTLIGSALSEKIRLPKTYLKETLYIANIPLRVKIIGGIISIIFLISPILFIYHLETTIRSIKEIQAKEIFNSFSRGEHIPYSIRWEVTRDSLKNLPFEKQIFDAIEEKIKLKEGFLFDYLSPAIFIFREKDSKTIEGYVVPMIWVEDKIKNEILPFIIISVILSVLSVMLINISIGRYISRAIRDSEKRIIITDDEFFRISSIISKQSYEIEDLSNKYSKTQEEVRQSALQIYSMLTDTRTGIHKAQEEIRKLKTSITRINQIISKDIETETSLPTEPIEPIYYKVNAITKDIKRIKDKVNEVISQITEFSNEKITTRTSQRDIHYDEMMSLKEVMLSKKIEFAKSNIEKLDEFLEKLREKSERFVSIVGKISSDIDKFISLQDDIEKLRKRLVILSVNTTIIAVRSEGQSKEELSIIAKQMSETIDEITKISNNIKEIKEIANRIENEYLSFSEDGAIKDILSDISGLIKSIQDIIEEDITTLASDITKSSSELILNMKQLSSRINETDEFLKKLYQTLPKIENKKHEISTSFEEAIKDLQDLSVKSQEMEKKCENISKNFELILEKYRNFKAEFQNIIYSIRSETKKIFDTIEKIEKEQNNIKTTIEKVLKFISDLLQG